MDYDLHTDCVNYNMFTVDVVNNMFTVVALYYSSIDFINSNDLLLNITCVFSLTLPIVWLNTYT